MPWFASPGFQKIRDNSLLTEESLHFLSRNEVLGRRLELELQKRTYAGVQSVSVDRFDSRFRAPRAGRVMVVCPAALVARTVNQTFHSDSDHPQRHGIKQTQQSSTLHQLGWNGESQLLSLNRSGRAKIWPSVLLCSAKHFP